MLFNSFNWFILLLSWVCFYIANSNFGEYAVGVNADNFNTLVKYGHSLINAPSLSGYTILTLPYSSDLRGAQIAADVELGNNFYIRTKIGGAYTGWDKIIKNSDFSSAVKTTGVSAGKAVSLYVNKLNDTQNYVQFFVDGVDKGYITFDVSRNIK